MNRVGAVCAAACVLMAAIGLAAGADGTYGELSTLATYETGDYGTGIDSASQTLKLRYVTGDNFQFRIDVPFVRAETSVGFVRGLGGVSPDRGRFQQGPGGGGSGGSGGSGSGGPALPVGLAEESVEGSETAWTSGLGDIELAIGKRLYGGGVDLWRFDASLMVKAPTADDADYLGTGEWDARAGLGAEYRFWSATGFGGIGYTSYGDPEEYELEDVVDAYVGVESDPLFGGRAMLSGWLEGRQEIVDGAGERTVLGIGLRTTGRPSWRAMLRTGLSTAAEDVAFTFGLSWGVQTGSTAVKGVQR